MVAALRGASKGVAAGRCTPPPRTLIARVEIARVEIGRGRMGAKTDIDGVALTANFWALLI
jgi:hypothetical protein